MNMITGYLGATSGEVKINGHDIFADPQEAKKMRGVFAGDTAALYGDDGAGVSGFRGRAERSG